MARRCFEVNQLEICFWRTTDERANVKLVFEKVESFFKKNASNTSYDISSKIIDECDISVMLTIKFSKSISVITIIKFLKYLEVNKYLTIVIREEEKRVIAEI